MTQIRNNEDFATSYDAVVIGSGPGGATLALKLAQANMKVLVVERGDYFKPDETIDTNDFLYSRVKPGEDLFYVGGRSKFYGAALYRYREMDFDETHFEAGISPAWPIDYGEMERYYCAAEKLFRVHGSPEGDPSEPWRSEPFPHSPLPNDPLIEALSVKMAHAGTPMAAIPLGLDYGDKGNCALCSRCDAFHCRVDAKMDADVAALRPAMATGNVVLATRTECKRINLDPTGQRAEGVTVVRDGQTIDIHAPIVSVSAGAPHSALLLRQSATTQHSEGIGNHSGQLGRQVGGHSTGALFPIMSVARGMGQRHTKTLAINAFYEGDADWQFPLGVIQVSGQMPFWIGANPLKQPVFKIIAQRTLTVFHMTEATPDEDTGWAFDGDQLGEFTPPRHQARSYDELRRRTIKAFGDAGYQVLRPNRPVEYWHLTGGAVMGADPAQSVVDVSGQVHGVDGLYVADASVPPTAAAVNTGLTIIALALRTAEKIAQKQGASSAVLV